MKESNPYINKILGIALIFLVMLISLNIHLVNKSYKKVGSKVVIGKDTLIIVDYSNKSKSYILSNGVEVSQTIIK